VGERPGAGADLIVETLELVDALDDALHGQRVLSDVLGPTAITPRRHLRVKLDPPGSPADPESLVTVGR
jgi:hypothetical protein